MRPSFVAAILALVVAGCAAFPAGNTPAAPLPTSAVLGDAAGLFEEQPPADGQPVPGSAVAPTSLSENTATSALATPLIAAGPTIVIDTTGTPTPIDPRLFGVNVAAWSGPERFRDPAFLANLAALGATVLRMPGGSWSNVYDWLGCENGNEEQCYWTWAARPSDFATLLRESGLQGMWTVSANGTPQEAAALVAYFNGTVDDTRSIGLDSRGRDWQTVGSWARLRRDNGNPAPLGVQLWEVGNELYGGKKGSNCASWGWEDVWTCDGTEYVQGIGSGAERREGFLAFRDAMRAVDPTIEVGAVGVAAPGSWSNWGNEVIDAAGDQLDFYVVHHYSFDQPPANVAEALLQAPMFWPPTLAMLKDSLGQRTPIAVTEYNLVSFQDADNGQIMRRAVNALATADTLGQLAQQGVAMANHWNLVNGRAKNGTDYGLLDADSGARNPAYYAFPLWRRIGSELLPVATNLSPTDELSVYAGRAADGTLALLAINKTASVIAAEVQLAGDQVARRGTVDTVTTAALDATEVAYNGVVSPAADLANVPGARFGPVEGSFTHSFPPFSISLIRLEP